MILTEFLKLDEVKAIKNIDSPDTFNIHRKIINKKTILKNIYIDFYNEFKAASKDIPNGLLVEIGSGSGFLKDIIPEIITTDVSQGPGIDLVIASSKLPFKDNSVSAFFLKDVLHHIKDPVSFFHETKRCLIPQGKMIMIEPFASYLSSIIFRLHHESFEPLSSWEIKKEGRLSSANLALSWIIFFRDRTLFESQFPELKIKRLVPHTPIRYIISGGLSMKQFLPSSSYSIIKFIEKILAPLNNFLGMFITIELCKEI